jgi:dTDP-4-amino-4,6-dideoxygalactose transaminase
LDFGTVEKFENEIAGFFGASLAIATDSCTHALELCLIHNEIKTLSIPKRTYISVPFLATKLNIELEWRDEIWKDYYKLDGTNIYDAAVFWKRGGYVPGSMMCLSFQFRKHLSLGRGGMILLDHSATHKKLKKMSYDGRIPNIPWREQNIDTFGLHYYMTPETAQAGLDKFSLVRDIPPRRWTINDWPDLTKMEIFKK